MPLLEATLGAALEFLSGLVGAEVDARRETLLHARQAIRRISGALAETIGYLEDGVHRLERQSHDPKEFANALSVFLDENRLQSYYHESGICEDLRNAQDQLNALPEVMRAGKQGKAISDLIVQIDGYERAFAAAVRDFLANARSIDLALNRQQEQIDPEQVLRALRERMDRLQALHQRMDSLAETMRERVTGT